MQSSESLFPEHKKKKTERKIFQADWIGSASMSKWWIICRRPKRAWTGSSPFNWCQELKQSEVFICQTARVQSIKHDPAFIWGMFLITECHKCVGQELRPFFIIRANPQFQITGGRVYVASCICCTCTRRFGHVGSGWSAPCPPFPLVCGVSCPYQINVEVLPCAVSDILRVRVRVGRAFHSFFFFKSLPWLFHVFMRFSKCWDVVWRESLNLLRGASFSLSAHTIHHLNLIYNNAVSFAVASGWRLLWVWKRVRNLSPIKWLMSGTKELL